MIVHADFCPTNQILLPTPLTSIIKIGEAVKFVFQFMSLRH